MEITKQALRKNLLKKRDTLSKEAISAGAILARDAFCTNEAYKLADVIYLYASFGSEVDTFEILTKCLADGKRIAYPKVLSKTEMAFFEITAPFDLRPGFHGIYEPAIQSNPIKESGCMLVPGVAFDHSKRRIGYGGGFYDRYLSQFETDWFYKIGIAYSFQILPVIESLPHDILMDQVIEISIST